MIGEDMGALLWRRYYSARVNGEVQVTMLAETLKSLLKQADVPEPEEARVYGPGGVWNGRTMNIEEPTS